MNDYSVNIANTLSDMTDIDVKSLKATRQKEVMRVATNWAMARIGNKKEARIIAKDFIDNIGKSVVPNTSNWDIGDDVYWPYSADEYLSDTGYNEECEPIDSDNPENWKCRVLSIDACRDGSSWTWNDVRDTDKTFDYSDLDKNSRFVLAWFRDNGLLSDESKGKIKVEDDGHNVVITAKNTGEPLFAIEYGNFQ